MNKLTKNYEELAENHEQLVKKKETMEKKLEDCKEIELKLGQEQE